MLVVVTDLRVCTSVLGIETVLDVHSSLTVNEFFAWLLCLLVH